MKYTFTEWGDFLHLIAITLFLFKFNQSSQIYYITLWYFKKGSNSHTQSEFFAIFRFQMVKLPPLICPDRRLINLVTTLSCLVIWVSQRGQKVMRSRTWRLVFLSWWWWRELCICLLSLRETGEKLLVNRLTVKQTVPFWHIGVS